MNPTFKTHIEAIYNYTCAGIIHSIISPCFAGKAPLRRMIQGSIYEMNKKTGGIPLKIKTIELADNFLPDQVTVATG
jgi:hypothetical protein